jgi:ribulose-phosphate 3-epimerase
VITIHAEATQDLPGLIRMIQKLGVKAGVSINPGTPVSAIESVLDQVDLVLVMSVNPGFAGQKFIDSAIPKIEWLKKNRGKRSYLIEIDGGIKADNIGKVRAAGAEVFVAGSSIFAQKDRRRAFSDLSEGLKKNL